MAEEMDISEEELAAVRAMVMAVSAGKVFFESKMVVDKINPADSGKDASECTPGCCD